MGHALLPSKMETKSSRADFSTPVLELPGDGVEPLRLLLAPAGNIQSLLSHTPMWWAAGTPELPPAPQSRQQRCEYTWAANSKKSLTQNTERISNARSRAMHKFLHAQQLIYCLKCSRNTKRNKIDFSCVQTDPGISCDFVTANLILTVQSVCHYKAGDKPRFMQADLS